MSDVVTALSSLKGVGAKVASHLQRLGLLSVEDLLFHLPIRYEDRTRITPIAALKAGDRVLIEGEVVGAHVLGRRGRASLVCRLQDETGIISLRFFHFNASQRSALNQEGLRLRCFSEVRSNYRGSFEMVHPEYRMMKDAEEALPLADRLTPIYPTTKGLSQIGIRKLVQQALRLLDAQVLLDLIPENLLSRYQLPGLLEALRFVHNPPVGVDQTKLLLGTHPMQQRLAFEELLAHHVALFRLRQSIQKLPAPSFYHAGKLANQFLQSLPFSLTSAQQRVCAEIKTDLNQAYPMLRLLQGDVGSGKTVVAAVAALHVAELGFQAVIMAPTEILAEQHVNNFKAWFEPLGVNVAYLTGSQTTTAKGVALKNIASGHAQVIVGTHAVFQRDVVFSDLALIIVDEQHRFGVHQRLQLKQKGVIAERHPHQLIMTATPIPRTLAMVAYSDLDCSCIDELPPGRKPVVTALVSNEKRQQIVERVRQHCLSGKQAYWVCTLIADSDVLDCQAAEATAESLQKDMHGVRVALIHGRFKTDEKEAIMASFKQGKIDLLVATTVIEVGVDVPNASLMVIENPERLGLAQLHQLRGRIGRGSDEGYCILLYQSPLSLQAKQRLMVIRGTQDGFKIAQSDLEMRGPGEILGIRQAGVLQLRVADLLRDETLMNEVQELAKLFIEQVDEVRLLKLLRRWIKEAEQYVHV